MTTPIHTSPETGRTALVTGASRGIGRAIALRLAAAGFDVAVGYAGNRDEAEKVVAQIGETGRRAIAVGGDVADEAAVAGWFDQAETLNGGVDVVVNSAGRMVLSTVADFDLDELDRLHRTNVRGTFVVAQQAARRLRDGGSVITFSSSVVGLAYPTYAGYTASKGAVEAVTLVLARELRGRDITVNCVAPGPTATDLFLDANDEAGIARATNASPLERLGTPEDIAEVVTFLAGSTGHWVNAQVIRANGGVI